VIGSSFAGIYHDGSNFNYAQMYLIGTKGSLLLADSSAGSVVFQPTFQTSSISGSGSLSIPSVARAFLEVVCTISGTTTTFYVPLI
jgi:hypothetical protein